VALNEIRYDPPVEPFRFMPERTREVVNGLELEYVDKANTVSRLLAYPPPVSVVSVSSSQLATEAWSRVLDHLNAGVEPPNERILLRDARVQLAMDHSRRAVRRAELHAFGRVGFRCGP
jgi:hypothetical protein